MYSHGRNLHVYPDADRRLPHSGILPVNTDPTDGKPGLRIETASSVLARDMITNHMAQFYRVIRSDRAAGKSTVAVYIDGLASAVALTIAGNQGGKDETTEAIIAELRIAIERDLRHLKRS